MTTNLLLRELARQQGIKLHEQLAVKADDIESDAKKAVEKIKSELEKVLGSRYVVKAHYSASLGKSILVMIHDDKPAHNIADNSPAHMKIHMYLSSTFGKDIDLPQVSWEIISAHYKQRKAGINFRKITSKKSIADATDKLIQWFKKNKPALDQLIEERE